VTRIGIVGAGLRGQLFHEALKAVPEVVLVGLCDPSAEVRARLASNAQLSAAVVETHQELYALGLDAVVVATPDFAHTEPVLDACAAGLDVVVEKPLAMSVSEATAIRDAVQAAGVRCVVAFENRWNPAFVRAQEALADTGPLISQWVRLSNSFTVPTDMLRSWASRSSPGWFLMPHTVDIAMWMSGSPPISVSAVGRRGALAARGIDTWDVLFAHLRFADGSVAALESAWVLPDGLPSIVDFRYEAVSEGARVEFDAGQQGIRLTETRTTNAALLPFTTGGTTQGMPQWMIRDIVSGLARGETVGPDVQHGLAVTQVVAAIHESAATDGQPVTLEETS
jgi:predicted dehydrogenase